MRKTNNNWTVSGPQEKDEISFLMAFCSTFLPSPETKLVSRTIKENILRFLPEELALGQQLMDQRITFVVLEKKQFFVVVRIFVPRMSLHVYLLLGLRRCAALECEAKELKWFLVTMSTWKFSSILLKVFKWTASFWPQSNWDESFSTFLVN